jgi:hypothetical protein
MKAHFARERARVGILQYRDTMLSQLQLLLFPSASLPVASQGAGSDSRGTDSLSSVGYDLAPIGMISAQR